MKSVIFASAFAVAAHIGVSTADAAPINYQFDVSFGAGALTGQMFTGEFSIDGDAFTGQGREGFLVADYAGNVQNGLGELLSFSLSILEYNFTEQNGFFSGDGNGSAVTFSDGQFDRFTNAFWVLGNSPLRTFFEIDGQLQGGVTLGDWGGRLDRTEDCTSIFCLGVLTDVRQVSEVPLPASLPLLLAGLTGLGLWRRKAAS